MDGKKTFPIHQKKGLVITARSSLPLKLHRQYIVNIMVGKGNCPSP